MEGKMKFTFFQFARPISSGIDSSTTLSSFVSRFTDPTSLSTRGRSESSRCAKDDIDSSFIILRVRATIRRPRKTSAERVLGGCVYVAGKRNRDGRSEGKEIRHERIGGVQHSLQSQPCPFSSMGNTSLIGGFDCGRCFIITDLSLYRGQQHKRWPI